MGWSSYRTLLLAGVAAVGVCGLGSRASATVLADSSDFQVVESCVLAYGCSGNFTVTNNSNGDGNWYIWGFEVGNPNVYSADTTQSNWAASLGCFSGSCIGNNAFKYSNNAGNSSAPADLDNDIAPGTSSDLFTFSSLIPGSPVNLDLVNNDGLRTSVSIEATDSVPEPASLVVLGTGLVGLFGARRRQRMRARS